MRTTEYAMFKWTKIHSTKMPVACALYQVLCSEEVENTHMHAHWIRIFMDRTNLSRISIVYKRRARDPNNCMYVCMQWRSQGGAHALPTWHCAPPRY